MVRTPDDRLRRLASHYEAEVGRTWAERLAASALLRTLPQYVRPHRRWLVAATAAATALVGVLGLGALADHAVPGQVLYPVDRAYESMASAVGVSADRSEERLVEALALIDRGRDAEAVELIDEALGHISRQFEVQAALVDEARSTATTAPNSPTTSLPAQTATTRPAQVQATTTIPAEAEVNPDPPPLIVAAADPSTSLRLATESLLRSVRDVKKADSGTLSEEVGRAASDLIAAAQVVKDIPITVPLSDVAGQTTTTTTDPTTTTSLPGTSTTSTTSATTSTTVPGSTTTTTTVPGSTTTTTQGTGPGPIIIPPQP